MSRKLLLSLATSVALTLAASPASAELVKVSYRGEVVSAGGPHGAAFQPGQTVRITYTVDTTALDQNADAGAGVFRTGARDFQIEIPAIGWNTLSSSATVQTFNNVGSPVSDQVFVYSNGTLTRGATLQGQAVTQVGLDFVEYGSVQVPTPALITSDAIPARHLSAFYEHIGISTAAGYTYVRVNIADAPTAEELVVDARERIDELVNSRQMHSIAASRLKAYLSSVEHELQYGTKASACTALRRFRSNYESYALLRLMTPAALSEMRAYDAEIALALGGC